jgi:hypothetical protein
MKRAGFVILFVLISMSACKKEDDVRYSGTMTIDNVLTLVNNSYYIGYGFSVPTGQKVSTLNNPPDVINVLEDHDVSFNVRKIFLSSNNFMDSFYKYGQYNDAAAASLAFNNLTAFTASSWTELADSILANQIWIFRTSDDKYAKIWIISTFSEKRDDMPLPYAECTFEWVFQPNGTQLFPGK